MFPLLSETRIGTTNAPKIPIIASIGPWQRASDIVNTETTARMEKATPGARKEYRWRAARIAAYNMILAPPARAANAG